MKAIILLSSLGIVTMLAGLFLSKRSLLPIIIAGLLGTLVANIIDWGSAQTSFYSDMVNFDHYAVAFAGLLIIISILIFILSGENFKNIHHHLEDNYALMLFALTGAVLMVSFGNLVMFFIGIETLSISLYILAGSRKNDAGSNEASLKYFLMGSFASGILLFGMVLMYGSCGSFNLKLISAFTGSHVGTLPTMFQIGALLMIVGIAFKVSVVPFHFWTPDVYQGSPTLITTMMASVVKIAGFASLFRLFYYGFGTGMENILLILAILSAVTMSLGNLTATFQSSFKRMLAYSSIAHAGYILIAVIAMKQSSGSAILYYTAAYSIATIGAFTALMVIQKLGKGDGIEHFNGLAASNKVFALTTTIAMLSLAGIPITAGFFGKYYIFTTAAASGLTWLVIIAVLNSAIGVYYYFKVIIAMYFNPSREIKLNFPPLYKFILITTALISLAMGIVPGIIVSLF